MSASGKRLLAVANICLIRASMSVKLSQDLSLNPTEKMKIGYFSMDRIILF